jgi:hypothetical protein
MEFQFLDMYCLDLIYEIEAARNCSSVAYRADSAGQQQRNHRLLPRMVSDLFVALRSVLAEVQQFGAVSRIVG